VRIIDRISLVGMKVFEKPQLVIGDDTFIGGNLLISVAKEVRIGKGCFISSQIIADNPQHPMLDPVRRIRDLSFTPSEVRPVSIGDYVWLATACNIFPGCTIGDGAIVLPGANVAGMNVPPFTIVGGNPARILAKLPLPKALREIVGDERYEQYREAHKR